MAERSVITLTEENNTVDVPQAGDTYKMPRATKVDTAGANTVAILSLANTAGTVATFRVDATPEGAVTGNPGDRAIDGTNGKTYIKRTGVGTNTGWADSSLVGATEANNTFLGVDTGSAGSYNTLMGVNAGKNMTGQKNTVIGYDALGAGVASSTVGFSVAIGHTSLKNMSTGTHNVGIGHEAGQTFQSGKDNVAIGSQACSITSSSSSYNVAVGRYALRDVGANGQSVGIGWSAGKDNSGVYNVVIGYKAHYAATAASSVVAVGFEAGYNAGTGCVMLGNQAGYSETGSSKLYISNSNTATPLIYGEFGTDLNIGFNTGSDFGGGKGCIGLKDSGTIPTTNPTTGIIMYSQGGVFKVRQSDGTVFDSGGGSLTGTTAGTQVALGVGAVVGSGANNTIIGAGAGASLTNGGNNIFVGQACGDACSAGDFNIGIGINAFGTGTLSAAAGHNIAIGFNTLKLVSSGIGNVGIGHDVLDGVSTGAWNTAIGDQAMSATGNSSDNVAIGYKAGNACATSNVHIGREAGLLSTGNANVSVGYRAMGDCVAASINNVCLGYEAGYNCDDNNIMIGYQAGRAYTGSNRLYIDSSSDTTPLIYGEFDNDNISFNLGSDFGGGAGVVGLKDATTVPTTNPTSAVLIYSEGGVAKVRQADGTVQAFMTGVTGSSNTQVGVDAGAGADYNVTLGRDAGRLMTGSNNVGIGYNAIGLGVCSAASYGNICIGSYAGYALTSGDSNVFIGNDSGDAVTTGWDNVAIGKHSMSTAGTAAAQNVFIGSDAGRDCTGIASACVGYGSSINTTGGYNAMLGFETGINAGAITYNVYLGYKAGRTCNGSSNVFIGSNVGSTQNVSNALMIDNSDTATPLIHGNFTNNNLGLNCGEDYGSGVGVFGIKDRTTAPTGNMTGGGILYSESGALKWRGSSGTVTELAPA